jgi:hypothetical protein
MSQERPRLLDLFCGAGGAAKGYQRAGFYVVGIDLASQPDYCGDEFIQAGALGSAYADARYSLQRRYNALNCGIGFDAEGAGFEPANAATRHRNLNPAELSATQALRCGAGSGEDASLRPRFSAPDRAPFARASRDSSRPPLRGGKFVQPVCDLHDAGHPQDAPFAAEWSRTASDGPGSRASNPGRSSAALDALGAPRHGEYPDDVIYSVSGRIQRIPEHGAEGDEEPPSEREFWIAVCSDCGHPRSLGDPGRGRCPKCRALPWKRLDLITRAALDTANARAEGERAQGEARLALMAKRRDRAKAELRHLITEQLGGER